MLVLRRKVGETLLIGKGIELTVLEVEGDRVKLGVKAPKSVEIVRKELLEAITDENKRASVSAPPVELIRQLRQAGYREK